MAPSPRTSKSAKSAFTLVEMLVSIAVLVLIMTFIAQMMNSVTLSTTLSDKHLDADAQARLVFDRMALDIGSMPLNNDLEYLFAKQGMLESTGAGTDLNDKMFFFSNAPAYFSSSNADLFPADTAIDPKSNMALIGYCINSGSDNTGGAGLAPPPYCLQRLSKGLTWDQGYPNQDAPGGLMFLTFPPLSSGSATWTPYSQSTLSGNTFTSAAIGSAPDYSGTDSDFDLLANQVFRMEFCFQVRDLAPKANGGTVFSNFPVAVYTDTNSASTVNQTTYSPNDPVTKVGGSLPHVGDRWYNTVNNRAFEYTGTTTLFTTTQTTGVTYQTWSPIGLSDVTAIVVTIAVIDSNSRKTLSQQQLSDSASYLPKFDNGKDPPTTPSGSPELMATAWEQALNDQTTSFASLANIPQAAVAQIRIYQHFFYLNQ